MKTHRAPRCCVPTCQPLQTWCALRTLHCTPRSDTRSPWSRIEPCRWTASWRPATCLGDPRLWWALRWSARTMPWPPAPQAAAEIPPVWRFKDLSTACQWSAEDAWRRGWGLAPRHGDGRVKLKRVRMNRWLTDCRCLVRGWHKSSRFNEIYCGLILRNLCRGSLEFLGVQKFDKSYSKCFRLLIPSCVSWTWFLSSQQRLW